MSYSSDQPVLREPCILDSKKLQSRDYKCPCGKTYLSYAALFTHIKQKHNGKAPGQIQKPRVQSKPRGRPPLASKNKMIPQEKDDQSSNNSINQFRENEDAKKNETYYKQFLYIFEYLRQLYEAQELSLKIIEQVNSFKIFQQFIDKNQEKKLEYKGVNIGFGLSQFLKQISIKTEPFRFEQVLILFMLLLQYVIDECNSIQVVNEAPIQILIEYMNPFINDHVLDFSEFLGIRELWIMDKNNMHNIFLCFYNWLKFKDYTSFCITLID